MRTKERRKKIREVNDWKNIVLCICLLMLAIFAVHWCCGFLYKYVQDRVETDYRDILEMADGRTCYHHSACYRIFALLILRIGFQSVLAQSGHHTVSFIMVINL